MGGYGSGQRGGRCTVESAFRISIDRLIRRRIMRQGVHGCTMHFSNYYDDLDVECIVRVGEPWDSWMWLRYEMTDYWTGEECKIDDKVFSPLRRHRSVASAGGSSARVRTAGCECCICPSAAGIFGRGVAIV